MMRVVRLLGALLLGLFVTACAERTLYVSDGQLVSPERALLALARQQAKSAEAAGVEERGIPKEPPATSPPPRLEGRPTPPSGEARAEEAEVAKPLAARLVQEMPSQELAAAEQEAAPKGEVPATPAEAQPEAPTKPSNGKGAPAAAAGEAPAAPAKPNGAAPPGQRPGVAATEGIPGREIPVLNPPVPISEELLPFKMVQGQPEYIVGPGDVLTLRLFTRGTERELSLLVPPSGTISISFVEDVQAAGLTPSEIDADITRRLSRFFRGPQVDVFVKEYSSKRIFFFGEVNRISGQRSGPGIYPLSGRTTLLELLLQAGSETPDADLKQVELTRDGKVYGLNLEDALFRGATEHNPVLQHNDRILISNKRRFISAVREKIRVSAYGEVNKAGNFDFPADQTFRIMDALAAAQGFTQRADLKGIRLIRQEKGKISVQKVNFFDILKGDLNQNVALLDGDQVFLDRSFTAKFSTVLNRVNPILSLILIPSILRDTYTTGGGLRADTGPPETGVSAEVTTVAREQILRQLPVAP